MKTMTKEFMLYWALGNLTTEIRLFQYLSVRQPFEKSKKAVPLHPILIIRKNSFHAN